MATKTTFRLKGESRDSYLELVLDFPPPAGGRRGISFG